MPGEQVARVQRDNVNQASKRLDWRHEKDRTANCYHMTCSRTSCISACNSNNSELLNLSLRPCDRLPANHWYLQRKQLPFTKYYVKWLHMRSTRGAWGLVLNSENMVCMTSMVTGNARFFFSESSILNPKIRKMRASNLKPVLDPTTCPTKQVVCRG